MAEVPLQLALIPNRGLHRSGAPGARCAFLGSEPEVATIPARRGITAAGVRRAQTRQTRGRLGWPTRLRTMRDGGTEVSHLVAIDGDVHSLARAGDLTLGAHHHQ
ncbi:hypothetical protein [Salana multivorans]